jgi:TPR repeat protein
MKQQKELNNMNIVVPRIEASQGLFNRTSMLFANSPSNDYAFYYGFNSINEETPLVNAAATENANENEDMRALKQMADAGDENAELLLTSLKGDEEAMIKLLISLAEKGYTHAQWQLAQYYDSSERAASPFIQKNDAKALEYYFKLADQGHKASRELLWMFYMGGLRTNRDFDIIMWGLKLILFTY